MPTQEIPREDWSNFFDVFSRQHEGWLVTLEVFGPEVGAQEEAHQLPFEGISIASDGGWCRGGLNAARIATVCRLERKPDEILESNAGGGRDEDPLSRRRVRIFRCGN